MFKKKIFQIPRETNDSPQIPSSNPPVEEIKKEEHQIEQDLTQYFKNLKVGKLMPISTINEITQSLKLAGEDLSGIRLIEGKKLLAKPRKKL